MKRVTGIGGIFFKADDPDKLRDDMAASVILSVRNNARVILVTAA